MVEKTSENHLGFALKDERKGQQSGFHRLDIFIKENTEDQLYKVKEVELRILSPARRQGVMGETKMTITHQGNQDKEYRVLPGKVILMCKDEDKIEFFTFGGEMKIHGDKEKTFCTLESPAPIFLINEDETLTTILIEEVEALFAQEHAKWGKDDQGFWGKLTEIPPMTCYASCLITLQDKLKDRDYQRINRSEELMNLLKRESKALEIDDVSSLSTLTKKGP